MVAMVTNHIPYYSLNNKIWVQRANRKKKKPNPAFMDMMHWLKPGVADVYLELSYREGKVTAASSRILYAARRTADTFDRNATDLIQHSYSGLTFSQYTAYPISNTD